MQMIKFKPLPHSRVRLSLTVPAEKVRSHYQNALARYQKSTTVKGFRKGHVPEEVVLTRFRDEVMSDALRKTIQDAIGEALRTPEGREYQLLQYDSPRVTKTSTHAPDKSLDVTVEFDVLPKVTLPDYAGLKVSIPDSTVSEQDIERELEKMQKQRTTYHSRGEGEAVALGDAVTMQVVDAKGTRQQDLRCIVGDRSAPPSSAEFVGMRVGEQKMWQPNGATAGAQDGLPLTVTLTDVKRCEVPVIDDHFATEINKNLSSVAALKAAIRSELEAYYRNRVEQMKKNNLIRLIATQTTIDLPISMIEMEKRYMWDHLLQQRRTNEDDFVQLLARDGHSKEQLFHEWHADVVKRLTDVLVLRELQEKERIEAKGEDVDAFLSMRAQEQGHDPDTFKRLYLKEKKMTDAIEECKEHMLFERLFKDSTFTIDKNMKIE